MRGPTPFDLFHRRQRMILLFLCLVVIPMRSQKLLQIQQVVGKLSSVSQELDMNEIGQITGLCFTGFGMKTCKSTLPDDDFVLREEINYYTQTLQKPIQYCLQCCGTSKDMIDRWYLSCAADLFTAITSNIYGYEFRFGQKKTWDDQSFVVCPLKRSACQYNGNELLGCNPSDDTYLWGYTLKLAVVQYSDNFQYWRGVSSCEVETIEKTFAMKAGDIFHETIIMNFKPQEFSPVKTYNLIWLLLTLFVFTYPFLLWYRTATCLVCNRKLILVPLPLKRCAFCLFINADLPDPILLAAIEAKGRRVVDADFMPVPLPWYKTIFKNGRSAIRFTFRFLGCVSRTNATILATREIAVISDLEGSGNHEGERAEEKQDTHDKRRGSEHNSWSSPSRSSPSRDRKSTASHDSSPTPVGMHTPPGKDRTASSVGTALSPLSEPPSPASLDSPSKARVPLLMAAVDRILFPGEKQHTSSGVAAAVGTARNTLETADNVSVLSQETGFSQSQGLSGALQTKVSTQTTQSILSHVSLDSLPLPPVLKRWLDARGTREKYVNPHILNHQYPKQLIIKAVDEDGRKQILTADEREKLNSKSTTKKQNRRPRLVR